ncbi:DUF3833 domain-containing protein [Massilia sp. W12]|uniref:DUF3833 domain-containing protein n=1 Tax=Massilia sp. W12 TaxID=3126507 RepID=UPI0030CD3F8E
MSQHLMGLRLRGWLLLCLCLALISCSHDDALRYRERGPAFDVAQFFTGKVQAWGIFQARDGHAERRFSVMIDGSMQDGILVLDEQFVFDDGKREQRVWRLRQQADGSWRGTAGDVEGEAVGVVSGPALHWRYTLLLPYRGSSIAMQMDDWMFMLDAQHVMNRTSMRKFGLEMGQVTLFFRKLS